MCDFPRTIPVPRGCGEREPGCMYVECGVTSGGRGRPLEDFLVDPPLPLPEGKGKEELANKPQLWVRTARTDPDDPATEYEVLNPGADQPIVDLLLWIGAEHYPYVSDYLEEVRRFGASRKLNPNLDLSQLTRWSRMLLIHPFALNTLWEQQAPPGRCARTIVGHAPEEQADSEAEEWEDEEGGEDEEGDEGEDGVDTPTEEQVEPGREHTGPCLTKCYELIPVSAASNAPPEGEETPNVCLREIGSTIYPYQPSGESAQGLRPGIFATLPITGFALIQFGDGSVNEKAKAKLAEAQAKNEGMALPFYETDR